VSIEKRIAGLGEAAPDRAVLGFAGRAADEGLVDVAYARLDSPLGELVVAATPTGLVRIGYADRSPEERLLEQLAARVSPRVLHAPARLDDARRQLDEYFAGRRRSFELATDWTLMGKFARRVLRRTAAIPYGEVSTYGTVAADAGSPRAARAAGAALGANPIPIVIPCHRVVGSAGSLTGYGGGIWRKERLLELEGAQLSPAPRTR
jgi:methylated-DNA-[protein]-cysteine S-methyltransferase